MVVGGAVGGWVGAGATETTKHYINQSRAWLSSLYYTHNQIWDLSRNPIVKEKGHNALLPVVQSVSQAMIECIKTVFTSLAVNDQYQYQKCYYRLIDISIIPINCKNRLLNVILGSFFINIYKHANKSMTYIVYMKKL